MSSVNIRRAVENIRANTTVYTPVVEMIVNAIQAIDEAGRGDGKITIHAYRSKQDELDGSLPDVVGFEIADNGIGFTDAHRDSFDTLYTDRKIAEGGKGFGRFTCLKYFADVHVDSVFKDGDVFKVRTFSMGKEHDIVVNENVRASERTSAGSTISLSRLKDGRVFDKKLATIARNIVERLLPYFITQGYACPDVILCEQDGTDPIRLNDFVSKGHSGEIRELGVGSNTFLLKATETDEEFHVRIFKFYSPRNQKSRISLVAHKREVSGSAIHRFIPEFEDEFCDTDGPGASEGVRNFIVKAYVFGRYLDQHVSLERSGFEFQAENDLLFGIGQSAIERHAAAIAREAVGDEITLRQERKKERVRSYIDNEAPWHKEGFESMDLSDVSYNASNEEIEGRLQKAKFEQERVIRGKVAALLAEPNFEAVKESVAEIVSTISGTSKNDLIHYLALRRKLLQILGKSLEVNAAGAYSSEGAVHDIIFPRKGDTTRTAFLDHNLWIVDERLNFTEYVSSDVPLDRKSADRPDLIAYNRRVLFRGDNEPSNPITIFEFKRPQRDDFVNRGSKEDPVQQIVRYVNRIRDGHFKTPEGRKVLVAENTPFFGYVLCDLTPKVEAWLLREKDFKPMPDRQGWFKWYENIHLYVEVISWDKVLKDAVMRHRTFFETLGI